MWLSWTLFALYAVVTAGLAWRGGKVATSSEGFAIGTGNMSPWIAGITLGACLASSATFVLFPGFVYADGLAGLIGFGPPFLAGLCAGLVLLAPRFQDIGADAGALTVPHWLGARYNSPGLRSLFGALNILQLAYLVLITVGCGYVMQAALGVPYPAAVIGIVLFVFSYTGFGGAVAHAFTNTLQGAVMLVIAIALAVSGYTLFPDAMAWLATTSTVAPASPIFGSTLEVWLVPLVIGIALTTQPHLLSKALYVRGRPALRKTLAVGLSCYAVYCLVLLVGPYAMVALGPDVAQDQVVAEYLARGIPWPIVGQVASVAILAASMSTLDGLLVAISASVTGDIVPGRGSVTANRIALALLGIATIALALSPPDLVLLLGQKGVYGLVAASAGPLMAGLFLRGRLNPVGAYASAGVALVVHFGLGLVLVNPGVTAAAALALAVPTAFLGARLGLEGQPNVGVKSG